MIEQLEDRTWKVVCDGCGEVIHTGQKSFQQAVNYISRAESWDKPEAERRQVAQLLSALCRGGKPRP
jgi:hypothetical protein